MTCSIASFRTGDLAFVYDTEDQIIEATRGDLVFTAQHDARGLPLTIGYGGISRFTTPTDARGLPVKVTDTLTGTGWKWLQMPTDA
jgi:hypothetical protein